MLLVVFALAFHSAGEQIAGLLGPDGLAPAATSLTRTMSSLGGAGGPSSRSSASTATIPIYLRILALPTIAWLHPDLVCSRQGLRTLCMGGLLVSVLGLLGMLPALLCSALAWLLYLSLVAIGGDFFALQWDALLIEAGALAVLRGAAVHLWPATGVCSAANLALRWLLFRLMFGSGVCKLASGCPEWRSLRAMHYHYWTQPLPHAAAWYAHNMPPWVHKMEVVGTLVVEGPVALLFLLGGTTGLQVAALTSIGLMVAIMLTGSFGFFNIMTAVLCLEAMLGPTPDPTTAGDVHLLRKIFALLMLAVLSCWAVLSLVPFLRCFRQPSAASTVRQWINRLKGIPGSGPRSTQDNIAMFLKVMSRCNSLLQNAGLPWKVAFRRDADDCPSSFVFRRRADAATDADGAGSVDTAPELRDELTIGGAVMTADVLFAQTRRKIEEEAQAQKQTPLAPSFIWTPVSIALERGLLPLLEHEWRRRAWRRLQMTHALISQLRVCNSYGLFARMTTERREVCLEASSDSGETWTPLAFKWKPGLFSDPSEPLPAPAVYHMPRLDWQLWFLPLNTQIVRVGLAGELKQQRRLLPLWFKRLVRGLLLATPDIIRLMQDTGRTCGPWAPGVEASRRVLRAALWDYRFSDPAEHEDGVWWNRVRLCTLGGSWRLDDPDLQLDQPIA